MAESIVYNKAFKFSLEIIKLYDNLNKVREDRVISKQILRSGTSIGANISEALQAQSEKDFLSKMNIALKEAAETEYWLQLLIESNFYNKENLNLLLQLCKELVRMLSSIVKTVKNKKCK